MGNFTPHVTIPTATPPVSDMANQEPNENLGLASGPPSLILPVFEKQMTKTTIRLSIHTIWNSHPKLSKIRLNNMPVPCIRAWLLTIPMIAVIPKIERLLMKTPFLISRFLPPGGGSFLFFPRIDFSSF